MNISPPTIAISATIAICLLLIGVAFASIGDKERIQKCASANMIFEPMQSVTGIYYDDSTIPAMVVGYVFEWKYVFSTSHIKKTCSITNYMLLLPGQFVGVAYVPPYLLEAQDR